MINRDKIQQRHTEYYKNNKMFIKHRKADYCKENKDAIKQRHADYYKKNKDTYLQWQVKYREKLKKEKRYYCDVCDLACGSKIDLKKHLSTLKHFYTWLKSVD